MNLLSLSISFVELRDWVDLLIQYTKEGSQGTSLPPSAPLELVTHRHERTTPSQPSPGSNLKCARHKRMSLIVNNSSTVFSLILPRSAPRKCLFARPTGGSVKNCAIFPIASIRCPTTVALLRSKHFYDSIKVNRINVLGTTPANNSRSI